MYKPKLRGAEEFVDEFKAHSEHSVGITMGKGSQMLWARHS
jgi:hypothetical protein